MSNEFAFVQEHNEGFLGEDSRVGFAGALEAKKTGNRSFEKFEVGVGDYGDQDIFPLEGLEQSAAAETKSYRESTCWK